MLTAGTIKTKKKKRYLYWLCHQGCPEWWRVTSLSDTERLRAGRTAAVLDNQYRTHSWNGTRAQTPILRKMSPYAKDSYFPHTQEFTFETGHFLRHEYMLQKQKRNFLILCPFLLNISFVCFPSLQKNFIKCFLQLLPPVRNTTFSV